MGSLICLRSHTVIVTQSAGVGLPWVCVYSHSAELAPRLVFHVCTSLFLSVSPAKFANFFPLRGQKRAPRGAAPRRRNRGVYAGPRGRNSRVHTVPRGRNPCGHSKKVSPETLFNGARVPTTGCPWHKSPCSVHSRFTAKPPRSGRGPVQGSCLRSMEGHWGALQVK